MKRHITIAFIVLGLTLGLGLSGPQATSVMTGTSAGCEMPSFSASTVGVGRVPDSVAVGDFNLDGRPDLAVANANSDNVTIQLNTCTANSPPAISGATISRQQGAAGTVSTIATVSDAQDLAGDLTVTATSVPAGLSVTGITNTNGTVTAPVAASCSASLGNKIVALTVTDSGGLRRRTTSPSTSRPAIRRS